MDRRYFLQTLAASAASTHAASAYAQDITTQDITPEELSDLDLSPDELSDIFHADAEPGVFKPGTAQFLGVPGVQEALIKPRELFEKVVGQIIRGMDSGDFQVNWAEDEVSPDYRHLEEPVYFGFFPVDHEVLERAAQRNSFELTQDIVLFGLRGARLLPSAPDRAFIRERYPNHQDYRCILGVWNRKTREVAALQSSTVPNARYVFLQQKLKARKNMSNLMPTGLHRYRVGPHRASSNAPQPGCWRQDRPFAVLRSYGQAEEKQAFTVHEKWDLRGQIVADNIHAGSYDLSPREGLYYFSSAGCQTVPGGYTRGARKPQRNWARFREMAGLSTPESYAAGWRTPDDGRQYQYMLLTAREVRLAYRDPEETPELRRLRYGSTGEKVRAFQQALGVSNPDGDFGPTTQIAYLKWQLEKDAAADGIVTPKIARDHFSLAL